MKRITLILAVFALAFSVNTTLASETIVTAEEEAAVLTELAAQDADKVDEINCDQIKCGTDGVKRVIAYYEVGDCVNYPQEKIKTLAAELAEKCCAKLKECCKENGCEHFTCEFADYRWRCVTRTKICILSVVKYECK
jgi:hypothetical protein